MVVMLKRNNPFSKLWKCDQHNQDNLPMTRAGAPCPDEKKSVPGSKGELLDFNSMSGHRETKKVNLYELYQEWMVFTIIFHK